MVVVASSRSVLSLSLPPSAARETSSRVRESSARSTQVRIANEGEMWCASYGSVSAYLNTSVNEWSASLIARVNEEEEMECIWRLYSGDVGPERK